DGTRVVFASQRGAAANLFIKPTSGLTAERQLSHFPPGVSVTPQDWSRDGRWLLYGIYSPATSWDIGMIPADGDGVPQVVLHGPPGERDGHLSPDMTWIAYDSTEAGGREVWLQPMPPNGTRWQVSTLGGVSPRWRDDGRELFYVAPDGNMMAVAFTPGPTPVV